MSFGVPLPRGAAFLPPDLTVEAADGFVIPIQVRPLDHWPDQSLRWALVDFQADSAGETAVSYTLRIGPGPALTPERAVRVTETEREVTVSTGAAVFAFAVGGSFPISSVLVDQAAPIDPDASGLRIECGDNALALRVSSVSVCDRGPLRAELEIRAASAPDASAGPLEIFARVELFAGSATVRLTITMRNRRRAQHAKGHWILGDPGSVHVRSASVLLTMREQIQRVQCALESGDTLSTVALPFDVHQESSGGENWNGAVHRNRDGRVPLRFRGYRCQSGDDERRGNRASPIVVAETPRGSVAVTMPQFWENFPRAIAVDATTIEIGLYPRQSAELHELQGGEQKTHVVVLAFGDDQVSDPPLSWCHDPMMIHVAPEWSCRTGAVPFLTPASDDRSADYLRLVNAALDPSVGFAAKCNLADEYGWRDFGDLPADHESAFQPADRPLVSHYNNQYDVIAGCAMHFLRTGDRRWWRLMADLAHHVRDIDVYHTREDKAAYAGGMFWHTQHYTDAGTSTHRTYPRGSVGGGPSAEHNYNAGLMLHYFLTGERASRDAAIGLGRWVIHMDDGRRTVFRWLAGGATGLASATRSPLYHGPGRGPANSILACLVAGRLSGESSFAAKADELVRRCIHPRDDLDARDLFNIELRWYYTVFLQVLGVYLHEKAERREFDVMFAYARASLLHYARWMAEHERPYLDHPELLEFPTETWAAQDMRKAEVFLWAALHAAGGERDRFLERARVFFTYSSSTLAASPTRHFTRPVALMLTNGIRYAWFERHAGALDAPAVVPIDAPELPPVVFTPQKTRAMRRAKGVIVIFLLVIAVILLIRVVL